MEKIVVLNWENAGYKIYSQNDEYGIIREIFNRIGKNIQETMELLLTL
jgi:hypothetical protein